jgi:hypothetical protein
MSTRGCFAAPSSLTTSFFLAELVDPRIVSTISAVLDEVAFVLIVDGVPPFRRTVAEPRVLPSVDTQATWNPEKVSVAVFPAVVA